MATLTLLLLPNLGHANVEPLGDDGEGKAPIKSSRSIEFLVAIDLNLAGKNQERICSWVLLDYLQELNM